MVNRVRSFLVQHPHAEWLIPAALCLVLLAQLLFSVRQMSQHADEATHLYAGYRVLRCADYAFGREHPPLAKMITAAPLLWSNPPVACSERESGAEDYARAMIWLYSQPGWWHLLMEARAVSSFFTVALCLGLWITARRMFGAAVAALSMALLVFEPNILGHGALLLNDILISALFLLTVFCFYLWSQRRSTPLLIGIGFCLGLALLTKYPAILLIPLLVLLAVIDAWLETSDIQNAARGVMRNFGALAAILIVAAATIWCGYGLRYSEGGHRPTDPITEQQLAGVKAADVHIVKAMRDAHLLPRAYLQGYIDVRGLVDTTGDGAYFLGRPYTESPWYCLPVTMTVKFTLAFLVILVLGCVGLVLFGRERRREFVFILLPGLIYLLMSLRVPRFSGIWHLFPMLPFLTIAAAAGCILLARRYCWAGPALLLLFVLHAASSLRTYPEYLSYANEAWGGPRNLYKVLPNTDVGQAYWEAKRYMDQHPNTPCWVANDFWVPAGKYLPSCASMGNPWVERIPAHIHGIVFVSSTWLALWGQPGGPYAPFYTSQPKALLGGSALLLYEGDFDSSVAAARALDNRVKRLLWADDFPAALLTAQEAVALAPSTATAHDSYCIALLASGYLQQALWECSTAQKLALPDLEGRRLATDFAQHLEVVKQVSRRQSPSVVR